MTKPLDPRFPASPPSRSNWFWPRFIFWTVIAGFNLTLGVACVKGARRSVMDGADLFVTLVLVGWAVSVLFAVWACLCQTHKGGA